MKQIEDNYTNQKYKVIQYIFIINIDGFDATWVI